MQNQNSTTFSGGKSISKADELEIGQRVYDIFKDKYGRVYSIYPVSIDYDNQSYEYDEVYVLFDGEKEPVKGLLPNIKIVLE
jgi:hypothetical protein